MRADSRTTCKSGSDESLALDWESLGRLVRVRTFDSVALHFVAAAVATDDASGEVGLNDYQGRCEP